VTATPSARERAAALAVLVAFALVLGALLAHHEMWRDELQAWTLARDSGSLAELWRNTRYEGHPLLWHLLLLAPAHLVASPVAMQVVHWLVAVAAAAVLLLRSPFPVPLRAALVFSYLVLYEYGAISRNYALTMLGVWLACAALVAARSPWRAAAGTVLAANASPMGMLLAPGLAAAIALTPAWRRRLALPLAVVALGFVAAVVQCLPPADYSHARGWFLGWDLERVAFVLRGYAVALLPVSPDGPQFWGASLLFPGWPFPAGTTAAIALTAGAVVAATVVGIAAVARPSARALALWAVGAAALLSFAYVKLPGGIRHHGFLWVLLVAVLWLAVADGAAGGWRTALLLAPFLAAGLWASAVAAWWDWRLPFSGARCAARELTSRGLDNLPLVGSADYAVSGVAGYLPHGRLFYPASGREGSFVVWNQERRRQERLTQDEVVAGALSRDRGAGVVLLLNQPLAVAGVTACREVFACGGAIVGDEDIWGYLCGAHDAGRR
jgi:hypothetical protein